MPKPVLLTPEKVADLLKVKPGTLRIWRQLGRGPAYVKVGRLVRYDQCAVDTYITDNTVTVEGTQ